MALMAVLPKEAVQQLFSHVLWMPPTLTWCCFDSLVLFLGSAAGAQPLLFLPLQHFAAWKTPGGTTDEVAEMSSWLSPPLIGTGGTLWGSTGPCFFSPLHQFCVKDYGFICLGCLALCQPLTGGGGLPAREPHTDTPSRMLEERALCLWQPLPPTLDTASGLGAEVSGLLLALQTSLDPALTSQVCGEKVSPDAALTPVPSSMLFTFRCWHLLREREEERIQQESQTPALPDVVNANAEDLRQTSVPWELPRTDWSLTTAEEGSLKWIHDEYLFFFLCLNAIGLIPHFPFPLLYHSLSFSFSKWDQIYMNYTS